MESDGVRPFFFILIFSLTLSHCSSLSVLLLICSSLCAPPAALAEKCYITCDQLYSMATDFVAPRAQADAIIKVI